jgi:polyribonucleotide nucleotidyltransferase
MSISDIPWNGPIAAVHRWSVQDGKRVVNPDESSWRKQIACHSPGTAEKINMIEAGAYDGSDESDAGKPSPRRMGGNQGIIAFIKDIVARSERKDRLYPEKSFRQ